MCPCFDSPRETDVTIGYGDNQPTPVWFLPFDLSGSDFALDLTYRGVTRTLTTQNHDLIASPFTGLIIWPITTVQSTWFPCGAYVKYRLRRMLAGGEVRTYARGRLNVTLDPIEAGNTSAVLIGPQGPVGRPGVEGPQGPFSPGFGYAVYADGQFTQASPLTIPSGSSVPLPIDGLGASTDSSQLKGVFTGSILWSSNKFHPRSVNDNYLLRVNFVAQSLIINNAIKLDVNIGGTIGSVYQDVEVFGTDAGQPRSFSFAIPLYAKSTFIANGASVTLTPDHDIRLWNAAIEIVPLGVGG